MADIFLVTLPKLPWTLHKRHNTDKHNNSDVSTPAATAHSAHSRQQEAFNQLHREYRSSQAAWYTVTPPPTIVITCITCPLICTLHPTGIQSINHLQMRSGCSTSGGTVWPPGAINAAHFISASWLLCPPCVPSFKTSTTVYSFNLWSN